jgi:hypothetical protein
LLPADRSGNAEPLARAVAEYASTLVAHGESLWRGLAVLGRALGSVGAERPAVAALREASAEVRESRVDERRAP